MREVQFREALREAMSEEMRRDPNVFLMGEEVAQYNGAYKVSQGMLDEFGEKRVVDTPIAELGGPVPQQTGLPTLLLYCVARASRNAAATLSEPELDQPGDARDCE